jgi:hypothetical protein
MFVNSNIRPKASILGRYVYPCFHTMNTQQVVFRNSHIPHRLNLTSNPQQTPRAPPLTRNPDGGAHPL